MRTTVLKRSLQLTILVLLAISFKSGWNYLQSGGIFPISVVKVEADYTHLSPKELQQAISNDLPASFWTVDVRALKSRLEAIAWVQSVDIQKIWPETLKIRVNEKKVFARWGKNALLSDKEEVFYPDATFFKIKHHLPMLYSPEGQTKVVAEQYSLMTQMLKTKKMSIKSLLLSDSGAWVLRLNNGTLLLLGRDEPIKRLSRFLRTYDAVFEDNVEGQKRKARRVDLRYPHGMAVSWVAEPEKQNEITINN